MPFADPEKQKEYHAQYALANRDRRIAHYHANREFFLEKKRKRRELGLDREKNQIYAAKYHKKNREARVAYCREWNKNNPGYQRSWVEANRNKRNTQASALYHRKKSDPHYRLGLTLRSRLGHALRGRGTKSARTLALLGCSIEFLREHLEKQFLPGMTWENYGQWGWHVDHILPCAEFHLQHSEEQEICFHWTNLQPLWAFDNRSKHDKLFYGVS